MGTWGAAAFDNDAAMDWLAQVEAATDTGVLVEAFQAVTEEAEYVEVDMAQCAVAAGEILAAFKGAASEHLPESAGNWVLAQSEAVEFDTLLPLALAALQRTVEDSEAADLWAEEGSGEWEREVHGLVERLTQD